MFARLKISLHSLFPVLLGIGYIFLLALYVLPYYPFPSDDVFFRENVDGKLTERMSPIRITIYIFRVFNHLLQNQSLINIQSTFDSMVVTVLIMNVLVALILFKIVRKFIGGIFWPSLVMVLYLTSEWTNLYFQFLSHAPFLAFFFILSIYLVIKLHEISYLNLGALKLTILLLSYTTVLLALVASSTAGIFWSVINILFLFSLFFPTLFSFYKKNGFWLSINHGWLITKSRFVPLLIAGTPFYIGAYYLLGKFPDLNWQYRQNINSPHFKKATEQFGQTLTAESFSILKFIYYHMPVISVATAVLIVLLILTRFKKEIDISEKIKNTLVKNLTALIVIVIFAIIIGEALPFTKLPRSFFAFDALICLIFVLSAVIFLKIHAGNKTFIKLALVIVILSSVINDVLRVAEQVPIRFGLSRFLAQYYGNAHFYALNDDPHYLPIIRSLTTLNFPADQPQKKITLVNDVKEIKTDRTAIMLVGPRGKKSGQSMMQACILKDFLPSTEKLQRPKNSEEFIFTFPGYLEAIYLEEEVCESLFFRNQNVNKRDSDKQVVVWVLKS